MIKTVMLAAVLFAVTATMAQAEDRVLAQGSHGRPHDAGKFAERMLLRRHHMTRKHYHKMRMHNEHTRSHHGRR